jgi:HSP20 family protein
MLTNFAPLLRLQDEMNRLFEDFTQDMPAVRPYSQSYPAINVWEEGDAAYLEAELPGLTMNDLEVLVMGNEVTLKGQRRVEEPVNASWHRRERSYGSFTRTLTLPWEIDADKVEARLQDGVLTVKLPKSESCRPRKISVQSA